MQTNISDKAEIVLRLDRITKRFGPLVANDAISLSLARGEIIALLGENGAGKTTLMNILFGHYLADEGSVEAFGKMLPSGDTRAALAARIGMVHQHFTLAEQMTVLDNIMLGTERLFTWRSGISAARSKLAALSTDFGLAIDPDALVSTLTVGERQRVEILKALYHDAKILILDEPTAVLTPAEADALFATVKRMTFKGLSVIFISHKLHEVMAAADRVIVLRNGKVVGERRVNETNRSELAELMVGAAVPTLFVQPLVPGPIMLELKNVSASLTSGHGQVNGLSLCLHAGEITGIAGVSGNGQAVIAGLLEGMIMPQAGEIILDGLPILRWSPVEAIKHGMARIPEDRHATGIVADMSVTENAISEQHGGRRFSQYGLMDWSAARQFATELISAYDVKCPSPEARVRLLSGGNMQKLILGRALDGAPAIIMAHQPTRGLDIGAVAYVQGLLLEARARGAAILLISEDLDEVLTLSDSIIVMSGGRLSVPMKRGEASAKDIGALMAGHGFAGDGSEGTLNAA
jgi:general nucleoside transport system ATP-binding protein